MVINTRETEIASLNDNSIITEMAERHNVPQVLKTARSLALQLQTLIENK